MSKLERCKAIVEGVKPPQCFENTPKNGERKVFVFVYVDMSQDDTKYIVKFEDARPRFAGGNVFIYHYYRRVNNVKYNIVRADVEHLMKRYARAAIDELLK